MTGQQLQPQTALQAAQAAADAALGFTHHPGRRRESAQLHHPTEGPHIVESAGQGFHFVNFVCHICRLLAKFGNLIMAPSGNEPKRRN